MQYHAIPCNTMQYHGTLITADGAYHCPVGSIMAIFSSVRSSNSHPDLLLIHHPTFSDSEPSGDDLGTTLAKHGNTLAYSGILWHALAYSGILWHTLAYSGMLGHTLAMPDWHTLAYFCILWQPLAYSCILWYTPAYSGILWSIP